MVFLSPSYRFFFFFTFARCNTALLWKFFLCLLFILRT